MKKYLVFRLYGPMAAWGEIAVGEIRRSASYPSRSAILGLISSALGIRRSETEKLEALFNGYDIGIKVINAGIKIKDYHTTQVPKASGKYKYVTRRDEIFVGRTELGTILSTREYRCDAASVVAVRMRESSPYTLEKLKEKLVYPEFVLYLGRKSCPMTLPLNPQIISAEGFRNSLDSAVFPELVTSRNGTDVTERYLSLSGKRYYWEGDAGDMTPQQTSERYDNPLNRLRWQFSPRKEHFRSAEEER